MPAQHPRHAVGCATAATALVPGGCGFESQVVENAVTHRGDGGNDGAQFEVGDTANYG